MKTPPLNTPIWVTSNNFTWYRIVIEEIDEKSVSYKCLNQSSKRTRMFPRDIVYSYPFPFESMFFDWTLDDIEN